MTASTPGGLSGSATGAGTSSTEPQKLPDSGAIGLERSIARLLTVGTYVSIALLVAGAVLLLAGGRDPLSGGPAFDPRRLVGDVLTLQPSGFLWAGLLVVVATPSARVVAALIGYVRSRERGMATVAALVLVVIVLSVAVATGLEG
jgi:uncharacterized membrane protein